MKIYLKEIREKFPEFEIRNYDENACYVGFNHDSRTIKEGELFIPIVGEKFDGHDFILQALESGASMSLCESKSSLKIKDAIKPIILVDTIEEGLQKILNYSISSINVPIVAITGSVGKTTTRNMLVSVLGGDKKVLSTGDNNINTVWGNAALLAHYTDEAFIVLECGIDRLGEMAWHMNSVDPDIGIFLNVGYVHAEKLGSIETVYEEKKNMADYLDRSGKPLVLNIDDERLKRIIGEYKSQLITFGKDSSADYMISDCMMSDKGVSFSLKYENVVHNVCFNAFGEDLAYNATAAIATAHSLGISLEKCIENLKDFEPEKGRFEIIDLDNGNVLVNDAYNASPMSMKMSMETFVKLYPKDKYIRLVFLGDMKELGDVSQLKHKELGELTKSLEFNKVYYMGDYFNDFGYGDNVKSIPEVLAIIKETFEKHKNVAILLKASHSIGLHEVPELLV